MAEYIEREAAIEQIKTEWAKTPLGEITGFAVFMRVLTKLPAADVAPVVRCKNCDIQQDCKAAQVLGMDGFCSYGAKMDGGEGNGKE